MSSQWSQGVVPAPAGVVANFDNPHSELNTNIAVHSVFLTISTLVILMRIYTRIHISRLSLGIDDCQSTLDILAWFGDC